ncbi:hypothetical protein ZIOFF_047910 [Zingiber officinale]|uniref:Uncharacterized protein n=1 Tax=Zingiber officinale TaxID=94328 RepID=A0A8J5FSB7_ZINOF|nr:hypothetical protein ZIOFF_047910 [Zingiber officinale]
MDGVDRKDHPICYNVSGVFQNDPLYLKTFGSKEGRERFLVEELAEVDKGASDNHEVGGRWVEETQELILLHHLHDVNLPNETIVFH